MIYGFPQYVTFANNSNGALTVQTLDASAGFTAASGDTRPALPIALTTGTNCTQAIAFDPATAGCS